MVYAYLYRWRLRTTEAPTALIAFFVGMTGMRATTGSYVEIRWIDLNEFSLPSRILVFTY